MTKFHLETFIAREQKSQEKNNEKQRLDEENAAELVRLEAEVQTAVDMILESGIGISPSLIKSALEHYFVGDPIEHRLTIRTTLSNLDLHRAIDISPYVINIHRAPKKDSGSRFEILIGQLSLTDSVGRKTASRR